nr:hypothetical protein CFP56_13086 [Quercus suber]
MYSSRKTYNELRRSLAPFPKARYKADTSIRYLHKSMTLVVKLGSLCTYFRDRTRGRYENHANARGHMPLGCSNTTTRRFWTTYVLLWRMALLYMINAGAFVAKPLLLWSRASCQVDNYCIEQHSSESAIRLTAHFHALVPPSDIFRNDTSSTVLPQYLVWYRCRSFSRMCNSSSVRASSSHGCR